MVCVPRPELLILVQKIVCSVGLARYYLINMSWIILADI